MTRATHWALCAGSLVLGFSICAYALYAVGII